MAKFRTLRSLNSDYDAKRTGGIAMAVTIPAPAWFIATDLALAYVPMAILGSRLAVKQFGPRAVRPAP